METERKRVLPGVRQLVPRAQEGWMVRTAPSPLAQPSGTQGPLPWHGAYGTSLSSSTLFHLELRAEIEARKFFVGEQGPYWVRV